MGEHASYLAELWSARLFRRLDLENRSQSMQQRNELGCVRACTTLLQLLITAVYLSQLEDPAISRVADIGCPRLGFDPPQSAVFHR